MLFKTSQDPSSPLVVTSNNGQANTSSGGLVDIRDGWDNEEWGSLEEDPVKRIINYIFCLITNLTNIVRAKSKSKKKKKNNKNRFRLT